MSRKDVMNIGQVYMMKKPCSHFECELRLVLLAVGKTKLFVRSNAGLEYLEPRSDFLEYYKRDNKCQF